MRGIGIRTIGILAIAAPVLLAMPAIGAERRDGRQRAARKACLTGDVAKGIELLSDLFLDTGNLTHIFNQGRCFEQNRRYEDAIGRFREYLVKGTALSQEEKADAEKHIAACQSYLGKTEPATDLEPAPLAATSKAPPPGSEAIASGPVATERREAAESRAGSGLRIAGMTTAAVGIAALAVGVAFNLKVNRMTSDLEKLNNYDRSTDASRKDYKVMGWVSYGVGVAGVAGGAVLYYLGWQRDNVARNDVSLLPAVVAGNAGLSLTGVF